MWLITAKLFAAAYVRKNAIKIDRLPLFRGLSEQTAHQHSCQKKNFSRAGGVVNLHCSLSVVTHALFHASVLRPASQAGPMHEAAGMREVS